MSMAEFNTQKKTYLNASLAYCPTCRKVEQARILDIDNAIYMERICEKSGPQRIKIAADAQWYRHRTTAIPKISHVKKINLAAAGCPFDCGICQWHANGLRLPIFSITNACNLDCPKCFTYNRPDKIYFKSVTETQDIIRHIIAQSSGIQLINLTGGEPTLHPNLFDILKVCKHEKIERITMNTNGVRLAEDEEFAGKLKECGVHLAFSLDTLNPETSRTIHGRDITSIKLKALEKIETLAIPTTILHVCIKGINDRETADIVRHYIKKDFVKSVTIQNMTFTGKNGSSFQPREHITMDEVEKLLCQTQDFSPGDFFALGSYHPLCYSAAYYIVCGPVLFPLTRLVDREILHRMSEESYTLNPANDFSRDFQDGINRLWAEGIDENILTELRQMIRQLYPDDRKMTHQERNAVIEKKVKMIYIHPHMDEDNFDIDRVSRCGDLVPDEAGNMIPACSYNLLYRQKDPRFWVFDDQKPFREKVSGLPKAFIREQQAAAPPEEAGFH